MTMRRRLVLVAVVLAAVVAGLGLSAWLGGGGGSRAHGGGGTAALAAAAPAAGGSTDFDPSAATAAPAGDATLVARGRRAAVAVFARPAGDAADRRGGGRTIMRRTVDGRRLPLVFRVLERRGAWLRVQLPIRPRRGADARGWIRARDVRLARTGYRIVIERRAHRLLLQAHGRTLLRAPIAVGRAVSPTPVGRSFVTDLLRPPNPRGFYGPYALGLSAYSPVYTSFAGGDGQIGIHGTDDPSVLGSDVSHGCIRVANAVITELARTVPLGTPVIVRA